jgi:hypothetical protein
MKTKKQVLAEFQQIQNSLCGKVNGFTDLKVYGTEEAYWSISLTVSEFVGNIMTRQDRVEWTHYTYQEKADEIDNENKLDLFKERFLLK